MKAHEIAMREDWRAMLAECDRIAVQLNIAAESLGRVKIFGCDEGALVSVRLALSCLETAAGLMKSVADA